MQRDTKIGIIMLVLAIIGLGFVLYINIYDVLVFLDNPLAGNGLGELCDGKEDCISFCRNSMGRCNVYCRENPSNTLCEALLRSR